MSWASMPTLWLGKENGPWQERGLKALKAHGDGLVALLDGVPDRNAAEVLKGLLIAAPRTALPETGADEFYWGDLLGLAVVNTLGESLGRVVGLLETGANDVLRVVDAAGVERLLPFVEAVVLTVDKAEGLIRVEWGSDW